MKDANIVAYATDWANEARATGADYKAAYAAVQQYKAAYAAVQQRARAEHPVYLGTVTAVTYNDKTDRYVVKFGEGSTAKATNDVAEFLLTHALGSTHSARPTVYAHFTDGLIDGALALFLARD
jgi:hypothetical protein